MYKETVMPRVEIFRGRTPCPVEQVEALLEKQAKLTWEARQKEVDEAEQRGIQKVVDWIDNTDVGNDLYLKINRDHWDKAKQNEWRAFLKEVEK